MFFILSGYVMSKDSMSISEFIGVKFRRIFLPAITLYISTLPLFFILMNYSEYNIFTIIDRIFYLSGKCAYNVPTWFFFCLFQVFIIERCINLLNASIVRLFLIVVVCLMVTYFSYNKVLAFSFLGMNKCILAMTFFVIGVMLRRCKYEKFIYLLGIISLPPWLILGVFMNGKVSMYSFELGSLWFFVLSGLFGSLFYYTTCKLLEGNSAIRLFSKWTVFMVSSHFVFVTFFKIVINKYLIGLPFFILGSTLFAIMVMILYVPICCFIERNCPLLIGRRMSTAKCIKTRR